MEDNNETVKDRLLQFLKAERISKSEFARRMGLSVAYVGAMRKSLPEEKVARMTELFPALNRDWLLYGEGEMYRPATETATADAREKGFLVPLLPVEAYAGNLQEYSRSVALQDCAIIGCPVRGADFAIPISGDSMEPEIKSGSYIAIRPVYDPSCISWGQIYVIVTDDFRLVKHVDRNPDPSFLTLRSTNPAYADMEMPRDKITGLFLVEAILNLKING